MSDALKNTYNNVEDIPEGLESFYSKNEETNTFTLKAEGMVDKARLDEFRENNINLRKEIESYDSKITDYESKMAEMHNALKSMEEKYSGIDLDEYRAAQEEAKRMAEKEMIEAGEVDKLINSRVDEVVAAKTKEAEALKEQYESKINALQSDLVGYDSQLSKMLVDNEITKVASVKGVRSSAIEDVLSRGRNIFRVEDGKAQAFNDDGRPMYMDDAVTPLNIDGWIEGLTKSAPHLFEASSGSGMQQPSTSSTAPAVEQMSSHEAILAGLKNL